MPFRPHINEVLAIDGVAYSIAEHPSAQGLPHNKESRRATVYEISGAGQRRALKVFKPRYRVPFLASLAADLASFATIPGLLVCHRTVLTPRNHADLLRSHFDLTYAALMPWVDGPTWAEAMQPRNTLSPEQSLALAYQFAQVLAGMERRQIAHCDLSGANLILPMLAGGGPPPGSQIELVDVEYLYAPGLESPESLPEGSPGYTHKASSLKPWSPDAGRFAGAVLLAEMLGWCDPRVPKAASGESYFDPGELGQNVDRFAILTGTLREQWGDGMARLFEHAWSSKSLQECPPFSDWLATLPVPASSISSASVTTTSAATPAIPHNTLQQTSVTPTATRTLTELAEQLAANGNLEGAVAAYRQAQATVPLNSGMGQELIARIAHVEAQRSVNAAMRTIPLPVQNVQGRQANAQPGVVTSHAAVPAPHYLSNNLPRRKSKWLNVLILVAVIGIALTFTGFGMVAGGFIGNGEQKQSPTPTGTAGNQVGSGDPTISSIVDSDATATALAYAEAQANQTVGAIATEAVGTAIAQAEATRAAEAQATHEADAAQTVIASARATAAAEARATALAEVHGTATAVAEEATQVAAQNLPEPEPVEETLSLPQTLYGHTGPIVGLAFSPDGAIMATGDISDTLILWQLSGSEVESIGSGTDFGGQVLSIAFSPDSSTLAAGSSDNRVHLWNMVNGSSLGEIYAHNAPVRSVAFSPDSTLLATGSQDKTASIWTVEGVLLHTFDHKEMVNSVAFSPDGLLLATASYDVRIWDVQSGDLLAVLAEHKGGVAAVAFSPDGGRLVSASWDKTLHLWSGSVGDWSTLAVLEGHTDQVYGVAFSPDGDWLASASKDHTVKVWDGYTGVLTKTWTGHTDSARNVAFSPYGRLLVSVGKDHTVRLWPPPEARSPGD
jgi:hypothetical protein